MPDDLKNPGPQDRSKINIHEDWELRWWSNHFGVSQAQLIAAVKAVGVSAAKVKAYLGK